MLVPFLFLFPFFTAFDTESKFARRVMARRASEYIKNYNINILMFNIHKKLQK